MMFSRRLVLRLESVAARNSGFVVQRMAATGPGGSSGVGTQPQMVDGISSVSFVSEQT